MNSNSPIIVTGIPRSGTSIIAGTFVKCGAFGGIMTGKRGLYENDEIRDKVVKPYLTDTGVDKLGQYPLPDTGSMLIPRNWEERIAGIIKQQGYPGGNWLYKDSRASLIWPVFHYAFPNAKWVLVRRKTGDIIQSCVKTAYMSAFKKEEGWRKVGAENEEQAWLWWIHEYEKRFVEMIEAGINVKVIWPERMVYGDYGQLYETMDWLGLNWNKEIFNFVEPLLWTSRKKERGL